MLLISLKKKRLYCFNQLGVSFNITILLSQVEFTSDFTVLCIDDHVSSIQAELGDDFEYMVAYLKKMETIVV